MEITNIASLKSDMLIYYICMKRYVRCTFLKCAFTNIIKVHIHVSISKIILFFHDQKNKCAIELEYIRINVEQLN